MERVESSSLRHDDDGRMLHLGQFFNGVALERWPNGQLAAEQSYVDGIEDGWSRGWHDNGVLRFVTFFRRGRVTGLHREWQ